MQDICPAPSSLSPSADRRNATKFKASSIVLLCAQHRAWFRSFIPQLLATFTAAAHKQPASTASACTQSTSHRLQPAHLALAFLPSSPSAASAGLRLSPASSCSSCLPLPLPLAGLFLGDSALDSFAAGSFSSFLAPCLGDEALPLDAFSAAVPTTLSLSPMGFFSGSQPLQAVQHEPADALRVDCRCRARTSS